MLIDMSTSTHTLEKGNTVCKLDFCSQANFSAIRQLDTMKGADLFYAGKAKSG